MDAINFDHDKQRLFWPQCYIFDDFIIQTFDINI